MGRLGSFNRLLKQRFGNSVSWHEKIALMTDVMCERLIFGTEIQDYFQYEFYNLKSRERRKYMTFTKLRYTMSVCNDRSKKDIFDNKALFNETFKDYLNRDWLDVTAASYEEFDGFIKKHEGFFAKAKSGMFGKNAGKYNRDSYNTDNASLKLYKQLKANGCIIEQLIEQHPSLEKMNKSSVNTLRIVTLICSDGNPRIMAGVLRVGRKGKSADNFHHFGLAATIDVNTGIVESSAIDRNFKRYILHPDSNEKIIGFQIPSWEKVADLVVSAARVVPEVRYVGWDVAIDYRGNVQLIEGNYGADPDVTQMPCRTGKWPAYKKEIDKILKK